MFDLEKSIADWRKQMLAAGIKSPAPVEELESHLREEIARQMQSGLNAQRAFEVATGKIGEAFELKMEFKQTGDPLETWFVKRMGIACVAFASLFSLWTLFFLFSRETSLTPKICGLAAVAATGLSWKYGYKLLPVIHRRWIRATIGGLCCLGGIIWIRFFCIHLVPNLLVRAIETTALRGWFLVWFLWAWSLVAMLGGIAFGLEKTARRENTATTS